MNEGDVAADGADPVNWPTTVDEGPDHAAWTARAVLPADRRAPWAARRLVATLLVAWGCDDQVEVAELVTGELVGNAVRHAGDAGDLEVELCLRDGAVQLWVADGSPVRPARRQDQGGADQVGGRDGLGLHLVDQLTQRWGVEDYLLGKRVWAVLRAGPSPRVAEVDEG